MAVLAERLGIDLSVPVLAAPMAGGPSTPALVQAAASAGSLGFIAGGYRSPEDLAAQIAAAGTAAFGVNLFVPNPTRVDPQLFHRYATELQSEADVYGLDLTSSEPVEDDDHWDAKIDLVVEAGVPVVSFTFGLPGREVLSRLRAAGILVLQTVTSPSEARLADAAGVDGLIVQASAAGGHSATFSPGQQPAQLPLIQLLREVRSVTSTALFAGGGLATPEAVAEVIATGVEAVVVGTALLLTDEAGTSATMRAALRDPSRVDTVLTRAFTGRPARAVRNGFVERHPDAPLGYPALHHLTSPLRRAAAAAGDPERINLWAGTGYRQARAEPAGDVITRLASLL